MSEVISGLAQELIGAGIADALYATTGTAVNVNYRRDPDDPDVTIILLRQSGGLSFVHKQKEQQGIQVLVDSQSARTAQAKARAVYDLWEEVVATTISGGHEVLWLRAVGPPQSLPTGPDPGRERFEFSVNFEALIVKE